MGGDHKCPVCQATFTRPQHVARHMRSHTGDRPYKCQYCGDQFARSDLLSRHINKCHANEKPVPTQGSRRKGSASASRATTSKQACDQCVQSSLPCDGSNPCAKCVQRKCRCTYVKFHRQTAPVGPGHNPRPQNAIPGQPSSLSSTRIPIPYGQPDDFFLTPVPSSSVPTMAETLYSSQSFAFPPLYPDPSSNTDFASKYRAQAELFRNGAPALGSTHFPPAGGTGAPAGPGIPGPSNLSPPGIYSDPRSTSGGSSWVSWSQEPSDSYHVHQDSLHDTKDLHRGHDSLSHRSHPHHQHPFVNNNGIPQGLQHPSSGVGAYPQSSAAYMRRGSVEFGDSDGSNEHSVPSSAASSVHLPLDDLAIQPSQGQQQSHPLSYHALEELSNHRGDFSGALSGSGPGSSSKLAAGLTNHQHHGLATDGAPFFPNMNMGINLGAMSSVSGLPAEDPDATPMPLKENPTVPMRSASASALNANSSSNSGTPRDSDLRELRDFWKQYMRTPLSGPDSQGSGNTPQQQLPPHQSMLPPAPRRPRVASMPSSNKTPTVSLALQNNQNHHQPNDRGGESRMRTTLPEDLSSYEAAVLARKAPTNLNMPKVRRGTLPALGPNPHPSAGGIPGGSGLVPGKGVGVVPVVKFDLLKPSGANARPPSSTSTTHSGSSGDGSASSSLAGAFGPQQQSRATFTLMRRGSPASSTGESSSRASSVSGDQDGDTDDDAASGDSGRVGRFRPSFKRLASQTLGPPNAKRAFLLPSAAMGGDIKDQRDSQHESEIGVDLSLSADPDGYAQGFAPGALGMH